MYDEETGLYYLRSRYYDPEWGGFINADVVLGSGGLLSHNVFAYCENKPIRHIDSDGKIFIIASFDEDFYYKWIHEMTVSEGTEDDCYMMSGIIPMQGTPFGYGSGYNGRGEYLEWWYGEDGKVIHSRHHGDHGNSKEHPIVPHDHDWHDNDKGKRTQDHTAKSVDPQYKAPEKTSKEAEKTAQKIMVYIAAYTVAIGLASLTGGAGYGLVFI